ncbi:hypothetical protein [Grimontia sp. NTOU-MAR1]|uniref:hypothetical protein n=1 Tax=Grimontia sp. NTOU-MAR1 TaxID=3111011 RepID=UPI002DB80088|nr:hypothetical protein [Grimontia sp. NTOU-MAR1]WRV97724.1 hypothetical protein VP504_17080 [Grimontia sp. NTOU-MAR1]
MKRLKPMLMFPLLIASTCVNAETITSTLDIVRTHTADHPTSAVRQHITVKPTSPLGGNCVWLYLTPEDKSAVSFLLAAKSSGQEVTIHYNFMIKAPWDTSSTCAIMAVDI